MVYHDSLPLRHRHAGGVDLGLRSHWAAAPPLPDGTPQVAEFDTYTDSLEALADWLRQRGVTTVALEATGVYWEPLFAILQERGFEVILVAPTYTSGIQGRPKTDRLDCQWIQRLHSHGLLPASFRPGADVAVLRHYLRQRAELVGNGARHIQHMQKALEQMNLKLAEVLCDITGLTGRKIIQAILAGQRDPQTLARLRDKPCHHSADTIARALRGSWRPEALFALQQAWDSWTLYQALNKRRFRGPLSICLVVEDDVSSLSCPRMSRCRRPQFRPGHDPLSFLHNGSGRQHGSEHPDSDFRVAHFNTVTRPADARTSTDTDSKPTSGTPKPVGRPSSPVAAPVQAATRLAGQTLANKTTRNRNRQARPRIISVSRDAQRNSVAVALRCALRLTVEVIIGRALKCQICDKSSSSLGKRQN